MSTLKLVNVSKEFKNKKEKIFAVKDFNLVVDGKEFIVFVGPSGCGKSTTLRMIAGLEELTSGEIYIDDELMNKVEPKFRNLAMMFQEYALYPHMNAYNIMAFALKNQHVPKDEIDRRVKEAAEILDISDILNRKPKAMSGGQRQRVALGKAMVRTPRLFLFDEPLSNLDAKLRSQMRVEITKLYEKLNTTFIYVTHDQVEAMTMGTRIVVLRKGIIQQVDTPVNLYDKPHNRFVAGFIGTPQMNFYDVTIQKVNRSLVVNLPYNNSFKVGLNQLRKIKDEYLDGHIHKAILGIRSEDIALEGNKEDCFKVKTSIVEVLGSETLIYADFNLSDNNEKVSTSASSLVIKCPKRVAYKNNEIINISFNKLKIHLFRNDDESGIDRHSAQNEQTIYVEE